MPNAEKIFILSACQLRLIVRSRARLLVLITLPLLAGLLLGLGTGDGAALAAVRGLFIILPVSAILLMASVLRVDGFLPSMNSELATPSIARSSEAVTAFIVLAAQAMVYRVLLSVLSAGPAPSIGITAIALVLSLTAGTVASLLVRSDAG